jgi:hypothetical protein
MFTACLACLLEPCAWAQIIIDTKILGAASIPSSDTLNQNFQNASLPPASNIQSQQSNEIIVQVCQPGTFAEGNASSCSACPAGTASNITASTSHTNCQTCSAGSWALQQAATCSLCTPNTFSPSFGAINASTCLGCPANSNSTYGTSTILNCLCADSYFYPGNSLQVLDPPATVQFPAWTSLALDAIVLDAPHLSCAS